jgi:hypothetical protein
MIGKEENKSEEVEYVRSSSELPKLPAFMAALSATLEGDVSTEAVQKSSQVNMGIRKQRPWFSISQEAKAEARFCPDGPRWTQAFTPFEQKNRSDEAARLLLC